MDIGSKDFWRSLLRGRYPFPEVVIVGLAAATHLFNLTGFPAYFVDEGTYISRGIIFSQTGDPTAPGGTFYFHPFLVWIILGVLFSIFRFPGNWNVTPQLLYLLPRTFFTIIGVFDVILVYYIVSRIYKRRDYALMASALFALTPLSVNYLRIVLLDSMMLFFILLSLGFLARGSSIRETIASGIVFGLAVLCKLPAMFFVPAFLLLILSSTKTRLGLPEKGLGSRLRPALTWMIPAGIVTAVWPSYALVTGQTSQLLHSLFYESSRQGNLVISEIVARIAQKDVFLFVAIAGVVYGLWKRDIIGATFSVSYLGLFVATGLRVSSYYLVPALPFLGLLATLLVIDISHRVLDRIFKTKLVIADVGLKAIGVGLILVLAIMGFRTASYDLTANQISAMNYVMQNAPNGAVVICNPAYSWVIQESRPGLIVYDWYSAPYTSLPPNPPEVFLMVDPGFSSLTTYVPNLQALYDQTNSTVTFSQNGPTVEVRATTNRLSFP